VDASGRDTFLANRFGIKRRNRYHNSAAMYGHFTGAQRLPAQGRRQHQHVLVRARLVLVHSAGRRHNQRGSGVLAVLHEIQKDRSDDVFMDTIAMAPKLQERLREAKLTHDVTATGNFPTARRACTVNATS
jgi:hypothetical protein